MEVAALELMLADPDTQETIKNFGGPLEPAFTGNGTAQSMVSRYGPDLTARLNQLKAAQEEVKRQYCLALDAATAAAGPNQPHSIFVAAPSDYFSPGGCIDCDGNLVAEPAVLVSASQGDTPFGGPNEGRILFDDSGKKMIVDSGSRGSVTIAPNGKNGEYQGSLSHSFGAFGTWKLDPVAFTSDWEQGDSALQKAFRTLYGDQALKYHMDPQVPGLDKADGIRLAGQAVVHGNTLPLSGSPEGFHINCPDTMIDPKDPPRLFNKDLVWFDPTLGWMTDQDNINDDTWLDKLAPAIVGLAATVMTGGAAAGLGAAISSGTGGVISSAVATSAISGVIGSAATQLAVNGKVNFGSLLQITSH